MTSYQQLRHRARRAVIAVLTILLVATGAVAFLPNAQKAEAALPGGMGDCEFRTSSTTSVSYNLSLQLCWLDLTGIDPNSTTPKQVTKQVGAYTLKFTWTTIRKNATGDPVSLQSRATYSTRAAFGNINDDGAMFVGGSGSPIVYHQGSPGSIADNSFVRFQLSNISVTNTATGAAVNDYAFNVVDAEETSIGEGISVDNGDTSYVSQPVKYLTPPENSQTCSVRGAAGSEATGLSVIEPSPAQQRDFICENSRSNPGSFVTTVNRPKQFTVTTWTDTQQGFALAFTLGRAGGLLKGDTTALNGGVSNGSTYEKQAFGAETGFDLSIWNTVSTAQSPFVYIPRPGASGAIGPQDGNLVGYLRVPGNAPDGSPTGTGTLYYKSTGANVPGGDASLVFKRYTPKWTCYISAGQQDQKTVQLAPANPTSQTVGVSDATGASVTFKTVNDPSAGTSQVEVTNEANLPILCQVTWVSNFKAATVDISKLVTGTASAFPEVQNRSYLINYTCTAAGLADAYPSIPLSGSIPIERNSTKQLLTLPQGANCTFSESFPAMPDPNNPGSTTTQPALPGKKLTLTWGPNPVVSGSYDSFNGANTLPKTSLTLAEQNTLSATNRFDYRGGTVDISKMITGEPVKELANTTRTYNFAWGCKDTHRSGTFAITVSYAADGTASGSGPTLTDVPVARDCWVRATSNLSNAEAARINSLPRTLTTSGDSVDSSAAQAAETDPNTYHFKLKDYAEPAGEDPGLITSPNASHITLQFTHPYSYKTAELKLQKALSGTGAETARREIGLTSTPFTANYRCTYGVDGVKSGTVQLGIDPAKPVSVPDIPLGASCTVWETTASAPQGTDVQFIERDGAGTAATIVQSADPNDTATSLNNDAAQSTPVHIMHAVSSDTSNVVKITNRYDQRLGTVSLTKLVDRGGIVGTLPSSYSFGFTCGARALEQADGTVTSVPLSGELTISEGGTVQLVATQGTPANLALVNDGPSGALRVPYGNDCTLSERDPVGMPPGVTLTSEFTTTKHVDSATNAVTFTNVFTAAGAGLTLDQDFTGVSGLFPTGGITYRLTCVNGFTQDITLSSSTPRVTVPASSVPAGTDCRLVEQNVDSGTRTINGVTFPIDRTGAASMSADGAAPEVKVSSPEVNGAPQALDVQLTVGNSSVLNITHEYQYELAPVTAEKIVAFDPATEQWISDQRKQVKRDRTFTVTLTCVTPTGELRSGSAVISATETSLAGLQASLGDAPKGSTCTAQEEASTTAGGVTLHAEAAFNGSADADPTTPSQAVSFRIGDTNAITMRNTYSRQLIELQLNKIARLPQNVDPTIRALYGAALNEYLHNHNFTLDCRDPLAADAPLGTPLTGSIKGEGSYTFTGVPAGLNCHISGDGFTQLDLTDSTTGRALESHFRTSSVDWIVDQNAAHEYQDTNVSDGVTDSNYFTVPSDGSSSHRVDLVNNYEFVMQDVTRTKQVVGTKAALDLLQQAQPSFSFTFRCSGVGYGDWGRINDPSIPNPLPYSSFTDTPVSTGTPVNGQAERFVRTYTSPAVQVPSGALCEGTELTPGGVPPELQQTVKWLDEAGQEHVGGTMTARVAGGTAPGVTSLTFINDFQRRMVPVRLAMMQAGFWERANELGYSMNVVCTDPAHTSASVTVPLQAARADSTVAQESAPQLGNTVMLPAGADCTLSLAGSPALAARGDLEMLLGSRTPFMAFGLWHADGTPFPYNAAEVSNPAAAPGDNHPYSDTVTPELKDYTFTFSIAPDAQTAPDQTVALTVGAEAVHPQAFADVQVTKNVLGDIGSSAKFAFESTCLPDGYVELAPGESVTLPAVPVTNLCIMDEVDDGVAGSEAQLSLSSAGAGLVADPTRDVVNEPSTVPGESGNHFVSFEVLPVADPSDPATSGERWHLTLLNTFPAIDIEKTISGPTTLVPLDNAVLDQNATSFEVHYAIRNNGGVAANQIALQDPSLAGRTLTRAGQSDYLVPADGTIDPAFCGIDPAADLAPGALVECTFNASIAEPVPQYVEISGGPATVTAMTVNGQVSDQDSFSAVRPIVGFLPMTGVQTLVWIMVLGLGVLAFGFWRNRRKKEDEEAAALEAADAEQETLLS